jgi:hypothetical protein
MTMERLVYLGENKQLFLYSPLNGKIDQLTYSFKYGDNAPSVWPVWSPDGKWIAYFQPPTTENKARICITEVDGIEVRVLNELDGRVPIYIKWSPTSRDIAVIEQLDKLELVVYSIDGGPPIPLDEGAPIFFEWVPDGRGVVAHLIHPISRKSSVQFYSIEDSELDFIISNKSGGFCSPIFMNEQLIFAEQFGDSTQVVLHDITSKSSTLLCSFAGVVAIQPRPNHRQFAVAVTSKGDGSPYSGIQIFDFDTGELNCLYDGMTQSLFWNSTGECLLLSKVDNEKRCMLWQFWRDGDVKNIGQFWPTREQLFFLHFFEQFSLSHNILSADGSGFYFSAYEHTEQRSSGLAKPYIFKGNFEESYDFSPIAVGLFPTLTNW